MWQQLQRFQATHTLFVNIIKTLLFWLTTAFKFCYNKTKRRRTAVGLPPPPPSPHFCSLPINPHTVESVKVNFNHNKNSAADGSSYVTENSQLGDFELVKSRELQLDTNCRRHRCTCSHACQHDFSKRHQLISYFNNNNRITVCIACDLSFPSFCKQTTPSTLMMVPMVLAATKTAATTTPTINNNNNNHIFAFR